MTALFLILLAGTAPALPLVAAPPIEGWDWLAVLSLSFSYIMIVTSL